jgi:hypothetical protein
MKSRNKKWIVLASFALVFAIIACSFDNSTSVPEPLNPTELINTLLPVNPQVPISTLAPVDTPIPTRAPMPTDTLKPQASAVGKWLDPDTSGTITTIIEQNGELVVVSISNPTRGGNELTSSSYANGVLTWEYCPAGMHCITSRLISVTSNSLTAAWSWSDGGNSGTTVYSRVP